MFQAEVFSYEAYKHLSQSTMILRDLVLLEYIMCSVSGSVVLSGGAVYHAA
jgi:hypothetical protein